MLKANHRVSLDLRLLPGDGIASWQVTMNGEEILSGQGMDAPYGFILPSDLAPSGVLKFTAETVMIGFASGAIGVGVTWLLCIPINAVIQAVTGIPNLKAYLPWQTALILVAISVLLTLLAGVIPSRSAARKDPVVALRTE